MKYKLLINFLALKVHISQPSHLGTSGGSQAWEESAAHDQSQDHQEITDEENINQPLYQLTEGEIDETIITYVQENSCLWNPGIPTAERTKLKTDAAWQSIADVFGNQMSAQEIKKRFDKLKKKHTEIRTKLRGYKSSGSAGKSKEVERAIKSQCPYYDLLEFLSDVTDPMQ